MTGVEAAAVAIAKAIAVGDSTPVGRPIDAVLNGNAVPTMIESASRGALDDTAAAHPDIVGALLDAHVLDTVASLPAGRPARTWSLHRRTMGAPI
jgi:hypothetical protein